MAPFYTFSGRWSRAAVLVVCWMRRPVAR